MKQEAESLRLSASDLAGHLACAHLTQLDRLAATGALKAPYWRDPMLDLLEERGAKHEAAYLAYLREKLGIEVTCVDEEGAGGTAVERTVAAMREGRAAISQATLRDGRWYGRADVLLRVEQPSELGAWSYEVIDTKLAAETRGGTVLQLCLYSDLVSRVQGRMPEHMHVVPPGGYAQPERFRVHDFLAYYRWVRNRLLRAVDEAPPETYPEPVPHCEVCRWWQACDQRRRGDDHLSLVAGASRLQRRELTGRGIDTLERLAHAKVPLDPRPARGSPDSYVRAHDQAALQLASRGVEVPKFNLVEPVEPGIGLTRLPAPSPGDVFLDFEGDPFVEGGGREYLFGWVDLDEAGVPRYHSCWALDPATERAAFEALVDELIARWARFADFHVYHFGAYEPSAVKRLMGRYATREDEVDRLLRGQRFVDLHTVVRQGVRVGVERYTLKDLETLHGFARKLDLREASQNLRTVERALEVGDAAALPPAACAAVEVYNRDDCLSTRSLRAWLEQRRDQLVAEGVPIERPALETGEAPAMVDERQQRIAQLVARLTDGVPADPVARSPEQRALWLLANLLDWHRRENKSIWWEYFRLKDLAIDDYLDEKAALGGLEFVGRFGGTDACPIHRYRFADQDHDVRTGQKLHDPEGSELGEVEGLDLGQRTVDVKKRGAAKDLHPPGAFVHDYVPPGQLPDSLERLATWVAEHGVDVPGPRRAARDLVLQHSPRIKTGPAAALCGEREDIIAAARRLVLDLDHGVVPVQGPPGAGKTYLGARVICALVRAGKKVGVTAVSHKVIRNLLKETLKAAAEEGVAVRCSHKGSEGSASDDERILDAKDYPALLKALQGGAVGAATAWAWARHEFEAVLDVLVVDEAGQMSLANTLAAAPAARSVVLLGDPRQLEQPIQGSHPEGADVSALEHLLQGHETMPADRGLFLARTWRLHPDICAFTSEIFYEGRLQAAAGCEQQRLVGETPFAGAGLWLVPVQHEGNQSSSPEEVERIGGIVDSLLAPGISWINAKEAGQPLSRNDILVVAPYNAQIALLSARLPGARVGTVDKFQGQEAPVVIYSMATSSPEDAPRGMEFLYSLNRFNVATSRARCVCIVVASPRLLEPDCRTPHQMRLANALCRYAELAQSA